MPLPSRLDELIGEVVVLDAASRYVFLGKLHEVSDGFLVLQDADAHDLRDTNTTRDLYVLDAKLHGISVNRRQVWVRLDEIVAVTRLSEIVD